MLSYYDIKNILRNKDSSVAPVDDFRIIDSYALYDEEKSSVTKKPLRYLCYEVESINPETGETLHFFKAIKFARVIRLPKAAKQSTSFMDIQQQILSAVYQNGYNMITIIANVIKPVPVGLLFLYGVQGVADNIEDAKKKADADFIGLTTALQGSFRVLEMRCINAEEAEWLRSKMYNMEYMTVVRGIPKANKGGEDMGNKGIGGKNLNPDSQGTLEEFIAGMADYEYVVQVLSTPVFLRTLKEWSLKTEKQMTDWNSQLQGTKSLSFNISMPMMFMANQSNSQGWSKAYTDADSVSYSQGNSFSNSYSESVGQGLSQTFGQSYGISHGTSASQSVSQSQSISQGTTFGQTLGQTLGQSMGQNVGASVNVGSSQNLTEGQSLSHSASQNISNTQGVTSGQSYSQGFGTSSSESHNVGSSQNAGYTEGTTVGHTSGATATQGSSQGISSNMGNTWSNANSIGTSKTHGITSSNTGSQTDGYSDSASLSMTNGHSTNYSHNNGSSLALLGIGTNASSSSGGGTNWSQSYSMSHGTNHSQSNGWSVGASDSYGLTNTATSSIGGSTSVGSTASMSNSHSLSESNSVSNSSSVSNSFGTSESYGTSIGRSTNETFGLSQSLSNSQSISNGVSDGWGSSLSYSQGISSSQGYSQGQSLSNSLSNSVSNSQSVSQSVSNGVSVGKSVGETFSESSSQSVSQGTSQSYGQSQGISQGTSNTAGTSSSHGVSTGTSGAYVSGMSSSMGFGPSVGYNKSYQWLDQQVKDILELLQFQNERIKKSLRSEGAFYTYVYIACPTQDALAAASAVAQATWQNEYAFVNPLQVLKLTKEEQKHLLYHFAAFSIDVTRESVGGVMQYKYSTVLLPQEYVAYCHLPRISEGGVFADVNDVPKFAVPSRLSGEIYMGTILSAERFTMHHGYSTAFDYRIDEKELMHGFFTGASRSGKTVAAMRFVAELANVKRKNTGKNLRIVCMDPKQDWRTLARFIDPSRFRFYSLGNCAFRPVKINPLKIPKGVVPQTWIDGVIDIYCRAYGLLERGKQMMGETIYSLYEEAGVFEACDYPDWEERVPELSREVTFEKVYKRMLDIKVQLEDPHNSKGRAGNDTRDAYARLLDRLQCFSRSFTVESKLFGTSEGIAIDELIGDDDVTILESSGLEKTFKNFIFGVITSGFYKFAKAHEGGFLAEDQYETVLVIEEANEVLIGNDCAGSGSGSSMGLTVSGQSEFEEILDQSAGYGLFIIAITQKIADMPKSIIANSGLVFAGRLKTQDDITVVIRSVAREERYDDRDLVKWFPRMATGMFICQRSRTFDFKDAEPILVQIARLNAVPPSNLEIDEMLSNQVALRNLRRQKERIMA